MISYADIQHAYNKLYAEIRRYMWEFQAVEALADLEIACYKTCQDLPEIRTALSKLELYTHEVQNEDEDLDKAFQKFHEILDDADETYVKLSKVNEVVQQ